MPAVTPAQRAAAEKVLKKLKATARAVDKFKRDFPAPEGYFWWLGIHQSDIELLSTWSDDDDL